MLLGHQGHEGRRADRDGGDAAEEDVDEASDERRVKTVLKWTQEEVRQQLNQGTLKGEASMYS